MDTRYILMAVCASGSAFTGLAGYLLFSDFLNEAKGLLPGDKALRLLYWEHPFPWDFKFWREVFDEHRRKFPGSHRIAVLKGCYLMMALFGIGLLLCFISFAWVSQ